MVKIRVDAENCNTGLDAVAPVPVRLTACGLPEALLAILNVPVRVPVVVGVKVTLIGQLAPAIKVLPQVLV